MNIIFEKCLIIFMCILLLIMMAIICIFLIKSFDITREIKEDIVRCKTGRVKCKRPSLWYRFVKRTIDIVFAVIAVGFTSPMLLLIGIPLRIEGIESMFCIQKIIGYKHKEARVYRFLTIIRKAEDKYERSYLDYLVHRSGIEYLPMFTSVLLGYMTLVGLERIPIEEKNAVILEEYEYYRPGILTLSAICNSDEEKQLYNKLYCKNAGIKYDIKLIIYALKNVYLK